MPGTPTVDTQWLSHSQQWRKALLIALPFGVLAFLIGAALEKPSFQATRFDLLAYPVMAGLLCSLLGLLALVPRTLRFVVTLIVAGAGTFFTLKLGFLVFFAATPRQFQLNMTETFYWVPIIYLLSFLVPGVKLGRLIASSFTVLCLALSVYYTFTVGLTDKTWGVVYALSQFNIANLVQLALTHAFIRFKESYTQSIVKNATIESLAYTDSLTGLPNRAALELELDTLTQQTKVAQQTSAGTRQIHTAARAAIFFIDLDNFKLVNDTLGHAAGDQLLVEVAERLTGAAGEQFVARLSGDEFIVLSSVSTLAAVNALANELQSAFTTPLLVSGQATHVTASIGVSLYPDHGRDITDLVRHADSAMYQVKRAGKNGFKYFQNESDSALERQRQLEKDLPLALEAEQFELHYQPVVDLLTGQTVKVEALLRWRHPALGWVSPADFIPVAERSMFITQLGYWVLKRACRDLRVLETRGWTGGRVAVNVSAVQFAAPDFHALVLTALGDAGLSANSLELEVTESLTLADPAATQASLSSLRRAGVSVALDDFGTGYSSLAYLRELPLDTIKIDRSFVGDLATPLGQPQFALALVEAIVKLADHLDLQVVAEGIETRQQQDLLLDLGVHLGQGYYFAKPMPADELERFLSTDKRQDQAPQAELYLN